VKEIKSRRALILAMLLTVFVAALFLLPVWKRRTPRSLISYIPTPERVQASGISLWAQGFRKIKEDRGEPVGKQAKVEIPAELKHYSDTRRFLAVQVAESKERNLETPSDFVDLASMIKRGELVELQSATEDYILIGVGGLADKEPFTRYENGKRVALYSEAELTAEYARINEAAAKLENETAGVKDELASLSKRERARRSSLQAQVNEKEKSLKLLRERKELLDAAYGTPERRAQFLGFNQTIEALAQDFSGRKYDTTDASARREMKVRMLSSLRPEALKVMEEIAARYREKFDRPLPLTSLIRPDEYQHALGKVNPNATQIATPPHSTGLAFDIFYGYMTADEQAFVMAYLAELKDAGRIEVLRENRNHYHVFAFVDGQRPDESFIQDSLGKTRAAKNEAEEDAGDKVSSKPEKKSVRNEARKEPSKKEQPKERRSAKARRR
jgi:hypothetical protein